MQAGADSVMVLLEENGENVSNLPPKRLLRGLDLLSALMHSKFGKEVIEQFMAFDPIAETAFRPDPNEAGKYLGNLYQIATQHLNKLGITQIYGGEHCTSQKKRPFFPIVETAKLAEWQV